MIISNKEMEELVVSILSKLGVNCDSCQKAGYANDADICGSDDKVICTGYVNHNWRCDKACYLYEQCLNGHETPELLPNCSAFRLDRLLGVALQVLK